MKRAKIKLLDFGLAKLTEPVEGKKVDARSDLFAFAAVLYEMLTGRRAFEGQTKISTLSAILNKEPTPLPEILPGDVPLELERADRTLPPQGSFTADPVDERWIRATRPRRRRLSQPRRPFSWVDSRRGRIGDRDRRGCPALPLIHGSLRVTPAMEAWISGSRVDCGPDAGRLNSSPIVRAVCGKRVGYVAKWIIGSLAILWR